MKKKDPLVDIIIEIMNTGKEDSHFVTFTRQGGDPQDYNNFVETLQSELQLA